MHPKQFQFLQENLIFNTKILLCIWRLKECNQLPMNWKVMQAYFFVWKIWKSYHGPCRLFRFDLFWTCCSCLRHPGPGRATCKCKFILSTSLVRASTCRSLLLAGLGLRCPLPIRHAHASTCSHMLYGDPTKEMQRKEQTNLMLL